MRYKVLIYGNSELRKKSTPVKKVDDDIRQIAKDMVRTMYENSGLGLAAEQVGRTEAIFVVDVTPVVNSSKGAEKLPEGLEMPAVFINPKIIESSGEMSEKEGCLSFPEIFIMIKRPSCIKVSFLDMQGRERVITAEGILARAIQHENDHLNGKLLYDHMSTIQKVAYSGSLKKLRQLSKKENL